MLNTLLVSSILAVMFMSLNALGAASQNPNEPKREFDTGAITLSNSNKSYPYRLLRPVDPETPAPLVIFLHGAGERGDNNEGQLKYFPNQFLNSRHLSGKRCHVLAMQCPKKEQWAPYRMLIGKQPEPRPAMKALIKAIKKVIAEEKIDPSRVYLTGLSMGGYGSWDLAARHPEWFAAVVPICGGGRPSTAERLKDVPIWAFHGTADNVVPEQQSRRMIDAIRRVGGTPAYSALPGVGHGSWLVAYGPGGAMEWMFAQRNPDPSAVEALSKQSNSE